MHRKPFSSVVAVGHTGVSARRSAFSLIELLIVIVIIAILAGFLLSAVNNARVAARETGAIQDIKAFEKAIADFKAQFGVEPPSFIMLCERASDWTNNFGDWRDGARRQSRAAIREMWPQYNFAVDVDINGGGVGDPLFLNGAECLAFFIGGLQQTTTTGGVTTTTARGFSSNPATPFSGYTGNRIGPFHELDPLRFVDLDADKIYEYMDSIPGQTKPIQYFSSYGGQGYRPFGMNTGTTAITRAPDAADSIPDDDEVVNIGGTPTLRSVYNQAAGTYSSTAANCVPAVPYKENGYQLISPGFDGDYGYGGYCHGQNGCSTTDGGTNDTMDPIGRNKSIQYERDNITNFKGGRLN